MYVIQRDDGKFVAPRGSEHSYTTSIRQARTFTTKEAAENSGLCENEKVVSVDSLLRRPE